MPADDRPAQQVPEPFTGLSKRLVTSSNNGEGDLTGSGNPAAATEDREQKPLRRDLRAGAFNAIGEPLEPFGQGLELRFAAKIEGCLFEGQAAQLACNFPIPVGAKLAFD